MKVWEPQFKRYSRYDQELGDSCWKDEVLSFKYKIIALKINDRFFEVSRLYTEYNINNFLDKKINVNFEIKFNRREDKIDWSDKFNTGEAVMIIADNYNCKIQRFEIDELIIHDKIPKGIEFSFNMFKVKHIQERKLDIFDEITFAKIKHQDYLFTNNRFPKYKD